MSALRPLREHQSRAFAGLRQSLLSGHKRPLLQMPTGSGKTLTAAHIVAGALGKGNRVATKLVQTTASDLGDLIRDAARATDLKEASPLVALAGGLFGENSLLSYLLELRIINELPGASILRNGDGAAIGALRLAEQLAAQ